MDKKAYPSQIHQNLNNLKKDFAPYFASSGEIPLLRFEDKDKNSSFFFEIYNCKKNSNEIFYEVAYKPLNTHNLQVNSELLSYPDLEKKIEKWTSTIKKFDEKPTTKEPIVKKYVEEYVEEYQLAEEGELEIFNSKKQLLISNYLEKTILFLNQYSETNTTINLDEPIQMAKDLKNQLPQLTKNEVVESLSLLWGVSRKKGLTIIKQIFFEYGKEVIISLERKGTS